MSTLSKHDQAVATLLDVSTSFRARVEIEKVKGILENFQTYNFIPDNISRIGEEIMKTVGPTKFSQPDNPNNGNFRNIDFYLGNEGSLVMYVNVKMSHLFGKNASDVQANLQVIGEKFGADEISVKITESFGDKYVEARFWWD